MTTTLPTPVHGDHGPMTRREYTLIGAFLAIALIIRVAIVIATRHTYAPVLDALSFNKIALSILHGHGFGPTPINGLHGPSAFRTPLWPAVLAAIYWVVGVKITMARLVLAVLSTGLTGLIGACAWTLLGRRVGLVTMGIAAIYPPLMMAAYGLNYETLMGVLLFGALLCTLRWRLAPARWWLLVAAGVLSGLAVLCRENAGLILVPICILVAQVLHARGVNARSIVPRLVGVVVLAAVVVVPWTIRNEVRLHAFIPVSDSPGIAIAGTYNATSATEDATWVPFGGKTDAHVYTSLPKGANEAVFAEREQSAAVSYAVHHPAYVAEVAFWNSVRFFDLRGPRDSNWLAPLIPWPVHYIEASVLSFYVLALISLFGIVTRRIRGVPWALWTFPILWFISLIFSTTIIQYRFITEPFFVLMAAATVVDLWSARRARVRPDPIPAS